MDTLVLILGLLTGEVAHEHVVDSKPQIMAQYQQPSDTRFMTDKQIEQTYLVPEGWYREAWIKAVRTVDLRGNVGRM